MVYHRILSVVPCAAYTFIYSSLHLPVPDTPVPAPSAATGLFFMSLFKFTAIFCLHMWVIPCRVVSSGLRWIPRPIHAAEGHIVLNRDCHATSCLHTSLSPQTVFTLQVAATQGDRKSQICFGQGVFAVKVDSVIWCVTLPTCQKVKVFHLSMGVFPATDKHTIYPRKFCLTIKQRKWSHMLPEMLRNMVSILCR